INKDFVRAAFDLLEVQGTPLFLSHHITYVITRFDLTRAPFPKIEDGYLMADLTCDPEYGLRTVANTVPDATYTEMKAASLKSIRKNASVNVLVISAHGEVDESNSGEVTINDEEL